MEQVKFLYGLPQGQPETSHKLGMCYLHKE